MFCCLRNVTLTLEISGCPGVIQTLVDLLNFLFKLSKCFPSKLIFDLKSDENKTNCMAGDSFSYFPPKNKEGKICSCFVFAMNKFHVFVFLFIFMPCIFLIGHRLPLVANLSGEGIRKGREIEIILQNK